MAKAWGRFFQILCVSQKVLTSIWCEINFEVTFKSSCRALLILQDFKFSIFCKKSVRINGIKIHIKLHAVCIFKPVWTQVFLGVQIRLKLANSTCSKRQDQDSRFKVTFRIQIILVHIMCYCCPHYTIFRNKVRFTVLS